MIGTYIVFILVQFPAGSGIIWHGCRNGAFYVELNKSESCALFAVAPSPWPQNSRFGTKVCWSVECI